MIARVCAALGLPDHSNGGETFAPSQVYPRGIRSPSLKAELVSLNTGAAFCGVELAVVLVGGAAGCLAQPAAKISSRAIDPALIFILSSSVQRRRAWSYLHSL